MKITEDISLDVGDFRRAMGQRVEESHSPIRPVCGSLTDFSRAPRTEARDPRDELAAAKDALRDAYFRLDKYNVFSADPGALRKLYRGMLDAAKRAEAAAGKIR